MQELDAGDEAGALDAFVTLAVLPWTPPGALEALWPAVADAAPETLHACLARRLEAAHRGGLGGADVEGGLDAEAEADDAWDGFDRARNAGPQAAARAIRDAMHAAHDLGRGQADAATSAAARPGS